MKKIVASSTVLFSILVMLSSCTKQSLSKPVTASSEQNPDMQPSSVQTINASVAPGSIYTLDFAPPSTASILKQASHFQISQTGSYNGGGSISYKYSPAANYTGTDEVTLIYTSPVIPGYTGCPGGAHTDNGNNYITIKINVGN